MLQNNSGWQLFTTVALTVLLIVFVSMPTWAKNCAAYRADLFVEDQAVAVQQDSVKVIKKSPTGAMLRSFFVPGWGQLYNGKWFKAILVCGAELGLIANAVYQNQMAVQSVSQWEREWYQDNRNLSVWWLLATKLLSIVDAYVDAHLYDFDESPDLTVKIESVDLGVAKLPCWGFTISVKL